MSQLRDYICLLSLVSLRILKSEWQLAIFLGEWGKHRLYFSVSAAILLYRRNKVKGNGKTKGVIRSGRPKKQETTGL